MTIREATIEDAPELATVHVQSWRAAYRGVLPQAYLDALDPAHRIPRWQDYLRDTDWPARGTLVAEDPVGLVGFVYVCRSRDHDLTSAGEVASIYVLPQSWGQGFGRQLMDAALVSLRRAGFDHANLWVLDSNARAIRFYDAGGWHDDGARKTDQIGGIPISEARFRRDLRRI